MIVSRAPTRCGKEHNSLRVRHHQQLARSARARAHANVYVRRPARTEPSRGQTGCGRSGAAPALASYCPRPRGAGGRAEQSPKPKPPQCQYRSSRARPSPPTAAGSSSTPTAGRRRPEPSPDARLGLQQRRHHGHHGAAKPEERTFWEAPLVRSADLVDLRGYRGSRGNLWPRNVPPKSSRSAGSMAFAILRSQQSTRKEPAPRSQTPPHSSVDLRPNN